MDTQTSDSDVIVLVVDRVYLLLYKVTIRVQGTLSLTPKTKEIKSNYE